MRGVAVLLFVMRLGGDDLSIAARSGRPDELTHELQAAAVTCAALARRADLWPDVRVEAIECAEALAIALADDAPPETRGLGDGADL